MLLVVGSMALFGAAVAAMWSHGPWAGAAAVTGFVLLALYLQSNAIQRSFAFTLWVLAWFSAALAFPDCFQKVGGFDQNLLIVPLIQIIMFGMGATLGAQDFLRALRMPKALGIGLCLQFTVMPLLGCWIANSFRFDPEVAAGVVLIGSCSGGLASNVMTYIARGNVALSVTMTACSTLAAPFVTPFAMQLLAGRMIEIQTLPMMLSIVNLILLPVLAGLLTNHLLSNRERQVGWRWLAALLGVCGLYLSPALPAIQTQITSIAVALLVMSTLRRRWLESGLPAVSMIGICYIIAIIAARSRQELLEVGLILVVAALLHNLLGYLLGYWISKLLGMEERECRTISFEVGMQNGGMGAALAVDVLKSSSAALAPAVFATWMNVTGSVLASFWKSRPAKADTPVNSQI